MPNIKVTKLAEKVLYKAIKESKVPPDKGLRLEKGKKGLTLSLGYPKEEDRVIRRDESVVLILSDDMEEEVGKATIDISNIESDPKLVIIREKRGEEERKEICLGR
jgi:hypothetical protein